MLPQSTCLSITQTQHKTFHSIVSADKRMKRWELTTSRVPCSHSKKKSEHRYNTTTTYNARAYRHHNLQHNTLHAPTNPKPSVSQTKEWNHGNWQLPECHAVIARRSQNTVITQPQLITHVLTDTTTFNTTRSTLQQTQSPLCRRQKNETTGTDNFPSAMQS